MLLFKNRERNGDNRNYYRKELKRKEMRSHFNENNIQISKHSEKMLQKISECCPALGQIKGALSRS